MVFGVAPGLPWGDDAVVGAPDEDEVADAQQVLLPGCRVAPGGPMGSREPTGPYRTLQTLQGPIEPYRALQDPADPIEPYRALQDPANPIGPYKTLQGSTEPHRPYRDL